MRQQPLKGSNLTTVRGINERLILHLLRVHGELTKAEATRITGLSPNATSVIFRALENEGLLLRGQPIRGRIGQPSIPIRLNPDARYYIGFKIGRRTFDLVIINFVGEIIASVTHPHQYPTPESTLAFLERQLPGLLKAAEKKAEDIAALNIAMPFELWSWTEDFDAPSDEMQSWRNYDLKHALSQRMPWPITIENDGTAACRAERIFGPANDAQDLVYFFVGTFIGGGIVLNGSVYPGRRGSAGGFGPLRVPDEPGGDRLVDHASLVVLEHLIQQSRPGFDVNIYSDQCNWPALEPELSEWLHRSGRSLAHAVISALAVIDFETVVIDGAFPALIRERLVREVNDQMDQLDQQGIVRPAIIAGHFGTLARAIGAAAYQISTEYMIDQNRLLRETPTTIFKS
ncbi:MAG: ROK family protein [Saccharospirillum sp.]